jgi:hypothetical protein
MPSRAIALKSFTMTKVSLLANVTESELRSAGYKILVPTCDAELFYGLREIDGAEVYTLNPRGAESLELSPLVGGDEPFRRIDFAPENCIQTFHASARGGAIIDNFTRWWALVSPVPPPASTETTPNDIETVWITLIRRLVSRDSDLCTEIVGLQRENSRLRQALQDSNDELSLISEHNLRIANSRPTISLSYPPCGEAFHPSQGSGKFRLTQYLPVSSRGVSAIKLYFQVGPRSVQEGSLDIAVCTIEDRSILGSWRLPFAAITDDPALLELSSPSLGPRRSIEIAVTWNDVTRAAPGIRLSSPAISARLRASVAGSPLRGAIAVTVYGALPSMVSSSDAHRLADEHENGFLPRERLSTFVSAERMATVRLLGDSVALATGNMLTFIGDDNSIQLHPVRNGISHAVIGGAAPVGTTSIVAKVRTAHPAASPIEYALAISPCGEVPRFDKRRCPGAAGFSGWHKVVPGNPHSIPLATDRDLGESCDIHIATRLPARSSSRFAWARWINFSIT